MGEGQRKATRQQLVMIDGWIVVRIHSLAGGHSKRISIPQTVCDQLGIGEDSIVGIKVNGQSLEMRKIILSLANSATTPLPEPPR